MAAISGDALVTGPSRPVIFACGALARDLRAVLRSSGLDDLVDVQYLPANLHNRPEHIVPSLRPLLVKAANEKRPVFIGYSDCGTGGALDALLRDFPGVTRLSGAHCYEMFAGTELFAALHDDAPGTFYLTDYLALHFEALVWTGLGLDRHPQLRDEYFGNYTRLVYLAQLDRADLLALATAAASRLELPFECVMVGQSSLRDGVVNALGAASVGAVAAVATDSVAWQDGSRRA